MNQKLLLDHNVYYKFGVVVIEVCQRWETVLLFMGLQMVRIHSPSRLRRFLQGGTYGRAERFPPNQVGKLGNLQDTWVLELGKA